MSEINIIISSGSKYKLDAVKLFTPVLGDRVTITRNPSNEAITPAQPINSGQTCAETRNQNLHGLHYKSDHKTILVSIENGIEETRDAVFDKAYVCLEFGGIISHGQSSDAFSGKIPRIWFEEAIHDSKLKDPNYLFKNSGIGTTLGESHFGPWAIKNGLSEKVKPDNWTVWPKFGGFSREFQIFDALINAFNNLLKAHVRETPDFPKPGVIYRDVNGILGDPVLKQLLNCLTYSRLLQNTVITSKVLALESRGFDFGSPIADWLSCGYVRVRKAGKMSGSWHLISSEITTEYSQDKLEFEADLIKPTDSILVVDDLVATGGSFLGVREMLLKLGIKKENITYLTILKVDALFEQACKLLGSTPIVVIQ